LLHAALKGDRSFRLLACSVGMRLDEKRGAAGVGFDTISKPGLWARVGPEAVGFLKAVLARVIRDSMSPSGHELPAIPTITRIVVEDSAILNLDARLADEFPATSNQHGTGAGLRLQSAFDLVTGEPLRLELTRYKRNDQATSGDIIPLLRPGDLLIRDLGYFSSAPFVAIVAQCAHYLSRHLGVCLLHHTAEGGGERINLLEHLHRHAPRPGDITDIDVLIGSGQKGTPRFRSRLVARRVPMAVEEKRLRRLGQEEKRRGNKFSAVHRRLQGWEIYITSLPREEVGAAKIFKLYPLRWRIEIIFKACKSHTALRAIAAHRSNANHVQAMLYAWLCALVLAARTRAFALAVESRKGGLRANYLSLLKVVARAFEMMGELMSMSCAPTSQIMGRWLRQISYHDRYEPRKRRTNMAIKVEETLELPPRETGTATVSEAQKLMT